MLIFTINFKEISFVLHFHTRLHNLNCSYACTLIHKPKCNSEPIINAPRLNWDGKPNSKNQAYWFLSKSHTKIQLNCEKMSHHRQTPGPGGFNSMSRINSPKSSELDISSRMVYGRAWYVLRYSTRTAQYK